MNTSLQSVPQPEAGRDTEALFFRQLQRVTARIHETDNIEQLMLDVSADICLLFNADRLTLYVVSDDHTAIVSKIKPDSAVPKISSYPLAPKALRAMLPRAIG